MSLHVVRVVKHLKTCIQKQFPGINHRPLIDVKKKWVDMKVYIVKLLWEKIEMCNVSNENKSCWRIACSSSIIAINKWGGHHHVFINDGVEQC